MQPEIPKHAELRIQAEKTIAESAFWLRVSSGHLSNCERGLAKLTPMQEDELVSFYTIAIRERLQRLEAALPSIKTEEKS